MPFSIYDEGTASYRGVLAAWVYDESVPGYRQILNAWVYDESTASYRQFHIAISPPTGNAIADISFDIGNYNAQGTWDTPSYNIDIEWFIDGVSQGVTNLGTAASDTLYSASAATVYFKIRYNTGSQTSDWVQSDYVIF